MDNIKILIIGKSEWISSFEQQVLSSLKKSYILERISDIDYALKRLEHDSYDILILQDKFSNYKSTYLTTLAYAMTRPSLVICNDLISLLKYNLWKMFSPFSMKFKISRKLICFKLNNIDLLDDLIYLANNHLKYFDGINKEFDKNIVL